MSIAIPSQSHGTGCRWWPCLLSTCVVLAGCGGSGRVSPHPVEPATALATLQAVLQSWKDGEAADSWSQRDPSVVVQDLDWMRGSQLMDFEILDAGDPIDANLKCQVRLTIVDPQQGEVERDVTYLVGTSPELTVFRQIIP